MTEPASFEATAEALKRMAVDALAACVKRGWRTDWSARGCYLHLEVSELIEACRGKGDSTKEEEAGDVLLVFLSLCGAYRIDMMGAINAFNDKLNGILAGLVGAGPDVVMMPPLRPRPQWFCSVCGPVGDAVGKPLGMQEECVNDCGGVATVRQ